MEAGAGRCGDRMEKVLIGQIGSSSASGRLRRAYTTSPDRPRTR
jgi:hypothetical protein